MLPYQGDDDDPGSLRSVRLKKWVVGMGKRERERMKELEGVRGAKPEIRPIKARDEIARERGVRLLSEGKGTITMDLIILLLILIFLLRCARHSSPSASCADHTGTHDTAHRRTSGADISSKQLISTFQTSLLFDASRVRSKNQTSCDARLDPYILFSRNLLN